MNEEILKKYSIHLHGKYKKQHTRRNYYRFTKQFLTWLQQTKNKDYEQITQQDLDEYKAYALNKWEQNGNQSRYNAINNFNEQYRKKQGLHINIPKSEKTTQQILSDKQLTNYLTTAKELNPLDHLIAIYQIDGILRPDDFLKLKISNHDLDNQILYTDDSKTGDESVILTPRMIQAFKKYLPYRIQPKNKNHNDYLIIINKGSNYGKPPVNTDYILRHTKKIAANAKIPHPVSSYMIKRSTLTQGFNHHTNPDILRRQARHKDIETTLRYNHTTDEMVKQHFNTIQNIDPQQLKPRDRLQRYFELYEKGEIDKRTLKAAIDTLSPEHRGKGSEDIGYL